MFIFRERESIVGLWSCFIIMEQKLPNLFSGAFHRGRLFMQALFLVIYISRLVNCNGGSFSSIPKQDYGQNTLWSDPGLVLSEKFKIDIRLKSCILGSPVNLLWILKHWNGFRDCEAWSIAKPMPKWVCDYCSLGENSFSLEMMILHSSTFLESLKVWKLETLKNVGAKMLK